LGVRSPTFISPRGDQYLVEARGFWSGTPGGAAQMDMGQQQHEGRGLVVAVVGDFYRQRVGGTEASRGAHVFSTSTSGVLSPTFTSPCGDQ